MKMAFPLAALSLLAACSPAAEQPAPTDTKPRAEVAAAAKPADEALPPVTDADGNELDPQLADAVREKMAEDKAALGDAEDRADAPMDEAAPAADEET